MHSFTFKRHDSSLNSSSTFVSSIDGYWGSLQENGTFNGIIGMVERKEIDAVIGSFLLNKARSEVTDYVGPLVIVL